MMRSPATITMSLQSEMHVTLLLAVMLLIVLSSPPISAQVISEKASILDTPYTIQDKSLLLTVKVGYSYSHEQVLKLIVESYTPAQSYDKIITVGPGTDVKNVDFALTIPPAVSTWTLAISLYVSNQKSETLDLLHLKNLDINLSSGQDSSGGFLLLIGLVVIIIALYYGGRKKKPKPESKKRHH
jgi:LPXTG-motif cell wall-anchored protein